MRTLELPEYSGRYSECCDAAEHRPHGSRGPWFCMTCGKTRNPTEDENSKTH